MYSLNASIHTSKSDFTLVENDRNCKAIDKGTGELCGERESLNILNEFQKLYESRIENVDRELAGEFERVSAKLRIMEEWIKDLGEQNIMLVHTVEDLEQAACTRVKLLEEKLQQSSTIVSENITRSNHTQETINLLSDRMSDLEKNKEYMQQRTACLENDIRGLLELIRRARMDNHWNIDGIQFFEIEPTDILAPIECTCDQEETDTENMQSLKLQVEQLQENGRKMVAYQEGLEKKVAELTDDLGSKDDIIKKYASDLQNVHTDLWKHSESADFITRDSFSKNDGEQNFGDTRVSNNMKDKQDKVLLHLDKTKLLMEKERDAIFNLKIEVEKLLRNSLNEKEKHNSDIDMIHDKLEDTKHLLKSYKTEINECSGPADSMNRFIATMELQVDQLHNAFAHHTDKDAYSTNTTIKNVAKNIDRLVYMCSEKEKSISAIECAAKPPRDDCTFPEVTNVAADGDGSQQIDLIKTLKVCALEAQVTVRSVKKELGAVVSSLDSRHKKYATLDKTITNMQNQLINTRERIAEVITKLEVQGDEWLRQINRVQTGNTKLINLKDEINHVQVRLSYLLEDMRRNFQDHIAPDYTEVYVCNNLMDLVMDELGQILDSLRVFQPQECCVVFIILSMLNELEQQLYSVESNIKGSQNIMDEVLSEHEAEAKSYCHKVQKLENLEKDVDSIYGKIQDILKAVHIADNRVPTSNSTESRFHSQAANEILQTTQDLYKLKEKYEDLQAKISQKEPHFGCDETKCQWKCRAIELQDQIRELQHENKRKQDANNTLRNSIKSMEEELRTARDKAENYRRSHSTDSMELKKKIMELENTLKVQRETECHLRQHLSDREIELEKSKEVLRNLHSEYAIEGALVRYGCNQFKNDAANVHQLFQTLQNAIQTTRNGLHELECDLEIMMVKDAPNSSSYATYIPYASTTFTKSATALMEKLKKYKSELDNCPPEVEKLKDTLYSKDKLLENMDAVTKIQKDSISMMQTELKELQQKLQEKINIQDQIISDYEKEKGELLKQNELQSQTIGHLQIAVVEAKRNLDHLGHKAITDVSDAWPTIPSGGCTHGTVHDI